MSFVHLEDCAARGIRISSQVVHEAGKGAVGFTTVREKIVCVVTVSKAIRSGDVVEEQHAIMLVVPFTGHEVDRVSIAWIVRFKSGGEHSEAAVDALRT